MSSIHSVFSDRYELIEEIGRGGFSSVFKGLDQRLEREVAIKVLNSMMSQNASNIERFMREAKISASLKHPNSLRIFDYGQTQEGDLYIVSELLIGESLQDKMNREGMIDEAWLLDKLSPICLALYEAHQAGVIHRDLKPDNLFVHCTNGEERLILIDFGISKIADQTSKKHTQTGQIFGTPLYMSPEQVTQAQYVDHRADLYSLGMIIFHALAGFHPFDSEVIYDILTQHLHTSPPLLHESNPNISITSSKLTQQLLQKEADHRIQDSLSLHDQIEACKQSLLKGQIVPVSHDTLPSNQSISSHDTHDSHDAGIDFFPGQMSHSSTIPSTSKVLLVIVGVMFLFGVYVLFLKTSNPHKVSQLDSVSHRHGQIKSQSTTDILTVNQPVVPTIKPKDMTTIKPETTASKIQVKSAPRLAPQAKQKRKKKRKRKKIRRKRSKKKTVSSSRTVKPVKVSTMKSEFESIEMPEVLEVKALPKQEKVEPSPPLPSKPASKNSLETTTQEVKNPPTSSTESSDSEEYRPPIGF